MKGQKLSSAASFKPAHTADDPRWRFTAAVVGGGGANPSTLFANGEKGDYWDAYDTSKLFQHSDGTGAVADSVRVGKVAGVRGAYDSSQPTESLSDLRPYYMAQHGAIRYHSVGPDISTEPTPQWGTGYASGFFAAYRCKVNKGFFRMVQAENSTNYPVLYDVRVYSDHVSACIAKSTQSPTTITGPTAAGYDWVTVYINRTANGNATLYVNGTTGTVNNGDLSSNLHATTMRDLETYGSDYDMEYRRGIYIDRELTADEIANTVLPWLEAAPVNNLPAGTKCSFSPEDQKNFTLSNSNRTAAYNTVGWNTCRGNIGKSTGKWYFEVTYTTLANILLGVSTLTADTLTYLGADSFGWGMNSDGTKFNSPTAGGAYGAAPAQGDVLGVKVDLDNHTISIVDNAGNDMGVMFSNLSGEVFPTVACYGNNNLTINAGQAAFAHTLPAGYSAWGV